MAAGHRRRLWRAQRGGLAGSGAWCPRRRRRRMPRRRAPRFYSRAVSSSWPRLPALPCRCILQPGGGRYPNYRPGWTVFHLPSTLWAAEAEHRPFRIQRTGHTRFRLQQSERVSSPSPRPLVEAVIPRRCLASPVSGELRPLLARARVQSNHPSSDWMHCVLAPERWIAVSARFGVNG